jgi:hypothetical protein
VVVLFAPRIDPYEGFLPEYGKIDAQNKRSASIHMEASRRDMAKSMCKQEIGCNGAYSM